MMIGVIRLTAIALTATLALFATVQGRQSEGAGGTTPDVARQLEQTFTDVADRAFPSVVGITIGTRDPDWTLEKQSAGREEGWREANQNRFRYPGFRPRAPRKRLRGLG